MARFLHHVFSFFRQRVFLLVITWVAGLLAGGYLFFESGCLPGDACGTVSLRDSSFVAILGIYFIPFALSAFLAKLRCRPLLLLVAFGKATAVSIAALSLWTAFGTAGWIGCGLLMFSEWLSLPLLVLFWLRNLPPDRSLSAAECMAFAAAGLLIASIDWRFVVPFAASLAAV